MPKQRPIASQSFEPGNFRHPPRAGSTCIFFAKLICCILAPHRLPEILSYGIISDKISGLLLGNVSLVTPACLWLQRHLACDSKIVIIIIIFFFIIIVRSSPSSSSSLSSSSSSTLSSSPHHHHHRHHHHHHHHHLHLHHHHHHHRHDHHHDHHHAKTT